MNIQYELKIQVFRGKRVNTILFCVCRLLTIKLIPNLPIKLQEPLEQKFASNATSEIQTGKKIWTSELDHIGLAISFFNFLGSYLRYRWYLLGQNHFKTQKLRLFVLSLTHKLKGKL